MSANVGLRPASKSDFGTISSIPLPASGTLYLCGFVGEEVPPVIIPVNRISDKLHFVPQDFRNQLP
jgi:hypothetical protein